MASITKLAAGILKKRYIIILAVCVIAGAPAACAPNPVPDLSDQNPIGPGMSDQNPEELSLDEKLSVLVAEKFPESPVQQQGVILLTKLISKSADHRDDQLLVLVTAKAKMGQTGISLLLLDSNLNIITAYGGDMPLSPCYTAHTARANGDTITFGCTDNTKWLSDSDQVVPVDIRKVKAVYDNGTEIWSPVQNNSYIFWVEGMPELVGLYFYNNENELQADHTEDWGYGLGTKSENQFSQE